MLRHDGQMKSATIYKTWTMVQIYGSFNWHELDFVPFNWLPRLCSLYRGKTEFNQMKGIYVNTSDWRV